MYFFIAFVGRSGSSYLRGLLDSHPDAACAGEILTPAIMPAGCSVGERLDAMVHNSGKRVSGFKLPVGQMSPATMQFLSEKGYRAIRLWRENKLDQFISMRLAQLNNKWTSLHGAHDIVRFTATPDEMRDYINSYLTNDKSVEASLSGFLHLPMTYERITTNEGADEALRFLDLSPCALKSRFSRQRSGGQRDALENYDELRDCFSDSPFRAYFVE